MANRPVKLKLLPRSVMKAKGLTRLPTRILGGDGILVERDAGTWTVSVDPDNLPAVVGLVIGTNVQAQDADLQALANNSTDGLWAHTGAGTGAARTLTAPAAGLTITNPAGIAGNPTLVLANDLAAIEGLASTGIAARIGSDSWAQRTITGTAAEITVTFGDGASGNPTISIPASVTFTGKTVTGGTFSSPTITTAGITGTLSFSIRSSGANAFDFFINHTETITANRTLTVTLNNASRTVDLGGNLTIAGAVSLPAIAQGDIWYGSATGIKSALAKDAVGNKFVKNSGSSNNPAWAALALSDLPTQAAFTFVGNNTSGAAIPTAVSIPGLTSKASPVAGDLVMIADSAASNAWKQTTVGALASAGSVSSLNGQTGPLTSATPAGGRLTLTTAVAVTEADVTGATSIFYTPALSNKIEIYDGSNFVPTDFTELTLALDSNSGHTGYHQNAKAFFLGVFNDAGTIRLGTSVAWASDTSEGTGAGTAEPEVYLGRLVNKVSMTVRFGSASGNTVTVPARQFSIIGGFYASADGAATDSKIKRWLSNLYATEHRRMKLTDATGTTYNYSTITARQARADAANQLDVFHCVGGRITEVSVRTVVNNSTATVRYPSTLIGLDSTTTQATESYLGVNGCDTRLVQQFAHYKGCAGKGRHKFMWLESGGGTDTQTWDPAAAYAGMFGETLN